MTTLKVAAPSSALGPQSPDMQEDRNSPTPIFLVEDSPSILKNLTKSLAAHPQRVTIVGQAMAGEEALQAIPTSGAKLVLLDLELPGIDGIEVTRRLKASHQDLDILILTSFDDERKVYEAIQAGASGYLVKRVSVLRILDAIDQITQMGGVVLEPIIARRFWIYFDSLRRASSSDGPKNACEQTEVPSHEKQQGVPYNLTPVEQEVLLYIGKGLSNAEVGKILSIDYRRIKTHLMRIYAKMGVNTHVEAVVKAIQAQLIEL